MAKISIEKGHTFNKKRHNKNSSLISILSCKLRYFYFFKYDLRNI